MPLSQLAVLKNKRLRSFIAFALQEGWQVKLTPKGNIALRRKGSSTIYNAAFLLEQRQYTAEQLIKYSLPLANKKYKRKGGPHG